MVENEKPTGEKLSQLEACEKLGSVLMTFQSSPLIADEICDDVRNILKTLCPGQRSYSREKIVRMKEERGWLKGGKRFPANV